MSKFMKKSVNLKREPEGVNSIASLRLFKFQILGPIPEKNDIRMKTKTISKKFSPFLVNI